MDYKKLSISLILPQLAGFIGSFFTASAIADWYKFLEKPAFTPPNWLFGPAWITLYFLMGISIYLIWQELDKNAKAKAAFTLFWIHLAFNAAWSLMFFGLKNISLAFINIVLIWIFIVVLIFLFWRIRKLASLLLIPYLLWVSYAGLLNLYIWILN